MTESIWSARGDRLPSLLEDIRVEVCVVGGGIAGLSVAHELGRRGVTVAVLDDGPSPGAGGETARSTAHLVTALDRGYRTLLSVHGAARTALAARSHAAAIDRAATLVREENVKCGFARVDGFLFSGGDPSALEAEFEASREAGVAVEWAHSLPLPVARGARALRYPQQGQLDPLRFTQGLAAAAIRGGGRVYGDTRVTAVSRNEASPVVRTARGATVACKAVVLATNAPIGRTLGIDAKQAAYRTYVVGAAIPQGALPLALYWDTDDPFHYVRLVQRGAGEDDLLLIGGEDHKTGQDRTPPEPHYERLEAWGRERFPSMGDVTARWSGQVLETIDGLGFIGGLEEEPDIHVVTGDCGNGITHALIAGMLIPDLIEGRTNPWAEVYDPRRLRLRAVPDLMRENVNVTAQLTSWLTPGEVRDEGAISPGSGAIVRRGLRKAAVYRDASNRLHVMSATCPHLGCVVAWNPGENTWDCPCHGSRFTARGRVLNGPANRDLEALDDDASSAVANDPEV